MHLGFPFVAPSNGMIRLPTPHHWLVLPYSKLLKPVAQAGDSSHRVAYPGVSLVWGGKKTFLRHLWESWAATTTQLAEGNTKRGQASKALVQGGLPCSPNAFTSVRMNINEWQRFQNCLLSLREFWPIRISVLLWWQMQWHFWKSQSAVCILSQLSDSSFWYWQFILKFLEASYENTRREEITSFPCSVGSPLNSTSPTCNCAAFRGPLGLLGNETFVGFVPVKSIISLNVLWLWVQKHHEFHLLLSGPFVSGLDTFLCFPPWAIFIPFICFLLHGYLNVFSELIFTVCSLDPEAQESSPATWSAFSSNTSE